VKRGQTEYRCQQAEADVAHVSTSSR
jgi:hypothetical protein